MVRALVGGAVAFVEVDDGLLSSEACGVRGRTRESRLARTRFVRSEDCNSCNKIVGSQGNLESNVKIKRFNYLLSPGIEVYGR